MAGTVTIDYGSSSGSIRSVTWSWLTDASGDANGVATVPLSGQALRFSTNPGSAAPTDDWDAVVNDKDGVDVAAGVLANRDTSNSEQAYPAANTYHAFDGTLTLVVTNGGNAKTGTITMYYRA